MKPAEGSTVIGKSVTIRGEVTGAEDLYLDGEVQGTITLSGNQLTVGPNAQVLADVEVRDIVVLGYVEGNIRASGRVDLRQTATIHGDIFTSRISIEEKAEIQGRVDVGPTGQTNAQPKSASVPAVAQNVPPAAPLFGDQQVG